MGKNASGFTRGEKAVLRKLASEAWESELSAELEDLFEEFCRWADSGMSAFDLSEKIHEFHNGASRELYRQYATGGEPEAVARAIAQGVIGEERLEPDLLAKLRSMIDYFREDR